MSVTSIQAEVTKTAVFNGSAVDISALAAPFEIEMTVDNLQSGAAAIFQLQTSNDSTPFASNTRVERTYSFEGPISSITPVSFSDRDYDLPGFRNGVTHGHVRLALTYLDAGGLTLAVPGTVTPTPTTGTGALAANTYFYEVTALGNGGETTASPEATSVLASTGEIALAWAAITGATSYRIYRGTTTGGEGVYYTSSTNSFTDIGGTSTVGTPPSSNTTGSPSVSYSAAIKN